ncbi:MAG: immunity 17 family protein [Dehalococcoidales bacterium]|nr:immunity 17 family protein [Dehalococcoidales bacterium]
MDPFYIIIIAIGVFFIITSYKNWDWFFKRANPLLITLSRKGLRLYFTISGLVIIGIGIYFWVTK